MFTEIEISAMRGAAAVDAAGAKIGTVGDVYLDDASGQPAWATVESGLFGTRVRFVPLGGARVEGRRLVLGFGKDAVLAAPRVAEDEHLSAEEESVLYAHYGVSALTPPAPAQDAEAAASTDAVSPVPSAAGSADDQALDEALEATEVAQQAAQKADPLGDGSYAGDASKAPLIDTADLEAHDHGRKDMHRIGRAAGKMVARIAVIDPDELSTERRDRHHLLVREAQAMLEHARTSAKAIAAPKAVSATVHPFQRGKS